MSFRDTLKGLVNNVDGGQGAVMMGYDGIPIDEFIKDDVSLDVQVLSVEYATLLKEIKRTIDVLKTGEMEEISITTGLSRVIVRPVSEEFFVVLVLDKDGNFGKGRFLLKRDAPKLAEALQ
jgi:predicted regulator of Ras-like GTPase activity (Roadblock/LC7/MglB family)